MKNVSELGRLDALRPLRDMPDIPRVSKTPSQDLESAFSPPSSSTAS